MICWLSRIQQICFCCLGELCGLSFGVAGMMVNVQLRMWLGDGRVSRFTFSDLAHKL